MSEKVIIRLFINRNDQKSRTKAFQIAVSQPGVESAAIKEGENYELEVTGQHIDAVALTNRLRKKKKLGQAQLVSVGPVAAGGNNANNTGPNPEVPVAAIAQPQPHDYSNFGVPQYQLYELRDPNQECCSIM